MASAVAAGLQDPGLPVSRVVLQAHLSHGIGASPFDSDVWHDEVNATLVMRSRSGTTTAELQQVTGDQQDLSARLIKLERDGFLRRAGDRVRTAFPILVGQARTSYFELVSLAAASIENTMRAEWQGLLQALSARGWAAWAYHFVWSQTMDSGFAWAPMMEQQLVPPLSQVVVWVVYPAHSFKSGTNYYPDTELRDQMLAVTWRPGAADTVSRVGREWQTLLPGALTGMTTPEGRERLRALDLIGGDGAVKVPVVKRSDGLYTRLQNLGEQHVRLVAQHLPLARLRSLTGVDDRMTFTMAYHDVSWDVLRRMVESGMLSMPAALRDRADDTASMAGVCAVIDSHPAFLAALKKALGIK
jgi:hypothetical protein